MPDLEPGTIVFLCAAIGLLLYHAGKPVHAALRRRRRVQGGARAEAVVESVGPLAPPETTEHPFVLRFRSPSGAEHAHESTRGFGGIVPVPGWRVQVLFDPDDPSNMEITDNPYTGPIAGAPAPRRPGRWSQLLPGVLPFAALALFVALFVVSDIDGGFSLTLFGAVFAAVGLLVLIGGAVNRRAESRLRRSPVQTVGTVTHSWEEWVRRSGSSSGTSRRILVYPYTVRYSLPDGRQVHRRARMATSTLRYQPGQQVDVALDPSDPTRFTVGPPSSKVAATLIAVFLGAFFCAIGVGIMVFSPA